MWLYYLQLGLRGLKRSPVLTGLTAVMLALGISACITTWTVYHLLSGDPIPQRSGQLYYPRIDPYPPANHPDPGYLEPLLGYRDAQALLQLRPQVRQTMVTITSVQVQAPTGAHHASSQDALLGNAAMFGMFDIPFRYGGPWTAADDRARQRVVVLGDQLNQQLFHGDDSVGHSVSIGHHDYRIVGVLKPWAPQPRFYAQGMSDRSFGEVDNILLPLDSLMVDGFLPGSVNCYAQADLKQLAQAACVWLGLWVELPTAAAVADYRQAVANYASQQKAQGRFGSADSHLDNLIDWLQIRRVVPQDVKLQANLAFGFLFICVLNAAGLLLAKCLRQSTEIGIRRALGATRGSIFAQYLSEAAVLGVVGGILGLLLSLAGLWAIRQQPVAYADLAHLDLAMFALAWLVAVVASVIAGLLPAWRSCLVTPALQLKAS